METPKSDKPAAAAPAPRASAAREVPAARAGETYTIKGGSSVVWGSTDAVTAPATSMGTVIAHDVDNDAKYEPVENNMGAVTGIVIYDTETVVKLTIVAGAAATLPAVGDTLTVGAISATVLKTASRAANKQTKKFEVTANKWANLTLA